jgi:hypothetical protein
MGRIKIDIYWSCWNLIFQPAQPTFDWNKLPVHGTVEFMSFLQATFPSWNPWMEPRHSLLYHEPNFAPWYDWINCSIELPGQHHLMIPNLETFCWNAFAKAVQLMKTLLDSIHAASSMGTIQMLQPWRMIYQTIWLVQCTGIWTTRQVIMEFLQSISIIHIRLTSLFGLLITL